jgi:hypothetical protein
MKEKGKYPGCIISPCLEEGGKWERYVIVHDSDIQNRDKGGAGRQADRKEESVRKERDMVDGGWRKRSLAPSLPPVHLKIHVQRVRRNTTIGNHTGTHTSRRTCPQPGGRKDSPGSKYPGVEYI